MLAMTPCENEVLKCAIFFAMLKGIRLCDIHEFILAEIVTNKGRWLILSELLHRIPETRIKVIPFGRC